MACGYSRRRSWISTATFGSTEPGPANHLNCKACWMPLFMTKRVLWIVLLSVPLVAGCGGAEKKTLGLDVDVYLHPTSSDSADLLLQAGIDRRLAETETVKGSI